ncbi:MAG: murein L,D-transpeptidase catalytic domain family protein [Sphingomonas sp.]|nr:murein L,D-transpeptidase catalytic domain family protein [Sphingomonas sp.]
MINRREMLRLGAYGAAGAVISTAAASQVFPTMVGGPSFTSQLPAATSPIMPAVATAPAGLNPTLLAKAKAALDSHKVYARDSIGVVDFSRPSNEPRFFLVDLMSGHVDGHLVAHGRGSDPDHSGFLEQFSNDFGSHATSNGTYTTSDYYQGKYGLSMKVRGLDWSNYNAEPRAIVIHNAWYAEPDMIAQHGKLGRSEGCFAFSRRSQDSVMRRLAGGRMIYADKLA